MSITDAEKQERFQILLQQIGLGNDAVFQDFTQGGKIEKLVVDKANKVWEFHLEVAQILPFELFQMMRVGMNQAFQQIAQTTMRIHVRDETVTERLVEDYWNDTITPFAKQSPMIGQLLIEQKPTFTAPNLMEVRVHNEMEQTTIAQRFQPAIAESLREKGFPTMMLRTNLLDQSETEHYKAFVEAKEKEDQAKALEAVQVMQKRAEQQANGDGGGGAAPSGPFQIGYKIKDDEERKALGDIYDEERRITVEGYVFATEIRELRSGRSLLQFKITDYTSSIIIKMFSRDNEDAAMFQNMKKGMWVRVRGSVQMDTFVRDLIMMAQDVNEIAGVKRLDTAEEKRVELHLHTPMSQMDATSSVADLVKQAADWGHKAIAITDHAVAQSFPEAYGAGKKNGVKILYGIEANLIDDGVPIAYNERHTGLKDATYVVFDVETTGLSAVYDTIIELAGVKMKDGEIIDKFEAFIDPGHPLSATTINLTGITDDMVKGSDPIEVVLQNFKDWSGDAILIAHNASFDMGFINTAYTKVGIEKAENSVIDTLELARFLYPHFKNHRLNTLTKKFNIILEQHHRAIFDAEATAYLGWKLIKDAKEMRDIDFHDQFNNYMGEGDAYKRARPFHATIYAKTDVGLKNLFKLVSMSQINYFFRIPRIPRSELNKLREGLIVGSACNQGEIFEAMMQKGMEDAERVAAFYDFIEVQPKPVYAPLIERELVRDEKALEEIISNLVKVGEQIGKPVVATGNVHYLNPNDKIYRKILIHSQGGANPLNRATLPDVHFRSTDEMLAEFAFLGEEKAKEIVVTNSNLIADWMDDLKPIKDDLYTPKIEGAEDEVRNMSYTMARSIYGETLPEIVEARLEKELKSIIGHGFAVIYLISHKLVKKSLNEGYLVGSRGSVGSSLVATMTEITEVNPLPPHYICPNCKQSEFFDDGSVGSGFDLPDKDCLECGTALTKEGQDIPFETFLGFKGDKVPDIDLNFSGEYQPVAHAYTKELFGEDYVYRAGTIGTVAEKTAFGYVRNYERDMNMTIRGAEVDRLVQGCTGVKRTTGQHPGGIIVIPDYMDVYDFSPIQFPADATDSEWKTTHFDFHSIHDNVLKLDILGHDDPTAIRMLQDLSGIDPKTIPTDDKEVMKLFGSTESLGVKPADIDSKTGTLGIPEFGTRFVRQMLEQTKPTTFSELVQISGLSHGTDVWLGNAEELIKNDICSLAEVIGCRDDIMVFLIYQGLDSSLAFQIMESVRKGKGLSEEMEAAMIENKVPNWYIDSCKKIKYMFPKAHAAAYVLMAVRIAYFKVHHPLFFYATYFTVRADDFDLTAMVNGKEATKAKMQEINAKGLEASMKEKSLLTVLEIANEMLARGFSFQKVDLYKSSADEFIIEGDQLIPPFNAIPSLGTNVAKSIVAAREDGEFLSKEDLQQRGKVSKTIIQYMDDQGCLDGLPDQNQLSLF
ncbi:PolC-type DNA polymerase III [Listeria rocourtiae]|uniref:PolC-type DNA polymerase III n=1 Tax=Listeria rocourtiae TaxID=647910 RepID=UPI00162A83F2|nr:PolC-type DNA polymerase III [Listeria rocourtiae]MBC1603679.1 PolC-type DNA polymerase III [Listeria rocourtiae]